MSVKCGAENQCHPQYVWQGKEGHDYGVDHNMQFMR